MGTAQPVTIDQTPASESIPRRYSMEQALGTLVSHRQRRNDPNHVQISTGSTGTPQAQQAPEHALFETQSARSSTPYMAFLMAKWSDYCEGLFRALAERSPAELADLVGRGDLRPARLSVAAEVLGSIVDARLAVGPLVLLLKHRSPMVREAAVYGLSHHLRVEGVVARLTRIAEADPSFAVKEAAAEAAAGDQ